MEDCFICGSPGHSGCGTHKSHPINDNLLCQLQLGKEILELLKTRSIAFLERKTTARDNSSQNFVEDHHGHMVGDKPSVRAIIHTPSQNAELHFNGHGTSISMAMGQNVPPAGIEVVTNTSTLSRRLTALEHPKLGFAN